MEKDEKNKLEKALLNRNNLTSAKKELSNNLAQQHKFSYPDEGTKTPEVEGRYRRSGARGVAFDPTKKSKEKWGKEQKGVNKPALRSNNRPGDSEAGELGRRNRVDIKSHLDDKGGNFVQKLLHNIHRNITENGFAGNSKHGEKVLNWIKDAHKQTLSEMKQTKPDLPKSEQDCTITYNNNKEFTPQEVAEELRKSLYKMVSKSIRNSNKDKASAQKVVEDVLDPNYVAEVNPEEVPDEKDGVLWKKKNSIDKLKKFKKNKIEKSKGVHQPIEPKGSQSEAGEATRKLTNAKNRKVDNKDWWGRASKETQSNHGKAKALSEHHKVIRDSRKMGKPDLPKSEE